MDVSDLSIVRLDPPAGKMDVDTMKGGGLSPVGGEDRMSRVSMQIDCDWSKSLLN